MTEDMVLDRVLKQTKEGKLYWKRNDNKGISIFNCRIHIHGKKRLILKAYLNHYNINGSYFDVKMSNGIPIFRMNIDVYPNVYKMLYLLDYKYQKNR
jgi:hypothetical protein